MENEARNFEMPRNEKVVLNLFGIEKNWVYSQSRGWVDMNEIQVMETNQNKMEIPVEVKARKSWKFWKRSNRA